VVGMVWSVGVSVASGWDGVECWGQCSKWLGWCGVLGASVASGWDGVECWGQCSKWLGWCGMLGSVEMDSDTPWSKEFCPV
jgi:hypothetical protein